VVWEDGGREAPSYPIGTLGSSGARSRVGGMIPRMEMSTRITLQRRYPGSSSGSSTMSPG
jgi:hypothetical protein